VTEQAKTPSDRGLVWAFLLDRKGGGHRIGWEGIASWRPEQGLLWAHFDITDCGADVWLEEKSGLEPQIASALLAEDTRPRSAPSRNGLLVILRGVNLNPGAEPDDMISVRVWLERDRIFTAQRRFLQTTVDIRRTLESGEGPASSGEFLTFLVEKLVDRIGESVDELDANIDAVEEGVTRMNVIELRDRLSALRRETAHLRRYLSPQRDALDRIYRQPDPILSERDNLSIREQADRVQRFLEDLDLIRERGMVTQEEFLSRIAYEQNQRILLLSVVAAIFLPLTFLTGLWGMNVGGVPGGESMFGFITVSVLMIACGAAMTLYFRHRNWL
jgi:zinc transporter